MECSEYEDLTRVVEEGHASPEIKKACERHRIMCAAEHPFVLEDLLLGCQVVREALNKEGPEAAGNVFSRNVVPILDSLEAHKSGKGEWIGKVSS